MATATCPNCGAQLATMTAPGGQEMSMPCGYCGDKGDNGTGGPGYGGY